MDDDFKSGREGRGLYYLSRAVNVGILKIPEEQLCHLHTEINAVVRFYIKEQSILVRGRELHFKGGNKSRSQTYSVSGNEIGQSRSRTLKVPLSTRAGGRRKKSYLT